jgi:HK97 family phage major capsid protein
LKGTNVDTQTLQRELQDTIATLQARATEFGEWRKADGMARETLTKLNARIDELTDQLKQTQAQALRTTSASPMQKDSDPAREVLVKYLRRGEQRLTTHERDVLEQHQKALSVDSDPDGGYLVTPQQSARIIEVVYETSPMRQIATVETISSDALEGLFDGDEAAAAWVAERGSRPETATPQLGQWRIPTHELYANPRATQKLLDDSAVDIEAWLSRKVADKFARTENLAFVLGTGVGQPRGIVTYPDGTTRGTIERIPSLDASTIAAEGIYNVIYGIKNAYRTGAVWVMNRATVGVIRTIRDESGGAGTGQFMWSPGFGTQPATLAGYPIVEFEDMADISGGNIVAGFGNFRQAYTIVDRIGIRVLRDPYSAKPHVEFYTTKRVGGDVLNFEAIKLMDIAAS